MGAVNRSPSACATPTVNSRPRSSPTAPGGTLPSRAQCRHVGRRAPVSSLRNRGRCIRVSVSDGYRRTCAPLHVRRGDRGHAGGHGKVTRAAERRATVGRPSSFEIPARSPFRIRSARAAARSFSRVPLRSRPSASAPANGKSGSTTRWQHQIRPAGFRQS
jgi:hypothetical protein